MHRWNWVTCLVLCCWAACGNGRMSRNPVTASYERPNKGSSLAPDGRPWPKEENTLCTLIACSTGADFSFKPALSWAQLRTAHVRLCHNEHCLDGSLKRLAPTPWAQQGVPVPLGGKPDPRHPAYCSVDVAQTSVNPQITIHYSTRYDSQLAPGDKYHLEFWIAGRSLLSRSVRVERYRRSEPNGKGCGACYSASFRF